MNEPEAPLTETAPNETTIEHTVTFTPRDGDTIVALRDYAMPSSHAPDHQKGWAYYVGERLVIAASRDS
jgi:hypothetical protein